MLKIARRANCLMYDHASTGVECVPVCCYVLHTEAKHGGYIKAVLLHFGFVHDPSIMASDLPTAQPMASNVIPTSNQFGGKWFYMTRGILANNNVAIPSTIYFPFCGISILRDAVEVATTSFRSKWVAPFAGETPKSECIKTRGGDFIRYAFPQAQPARISQVTELHLFVSSSQGKHLCISCPTLNSAN